MASEIPNIDPPELRLAAFRLQRLTNLNYPSSDADKSETPHRHNFQELIWIESGLGLHEIDGQPFSIEPRTLYLIAQGQVHCFMEAKGVHGYVVSFADDFLPDPVAPTGRSHHALFNNVQTLSALRVNQRDTRGIEKLLELLDEEYQHAESSGADAVLRPLLQALLIKIEQLLCDNMDAHNTTVCSDSLLSQFLIELEKHYSKHHDVEFYARTLATTPRQLSAAVKHYQGKTAKRLIEERLILEAKRRLRFTDLTIKEIANQLGFPDPSYFSKVFRRHTLTAPLEFKTR